MVCRENKGRSATMGYEKHVQSLHGEAFSDAEMQGLQHKIQHEVEGLNYDAMTVEDQIQMWREYKSHIEKDDTLTEAQKYRKSFKRPGVVTRIDQEIERLQTGKHENGQELSPAQKNNMAQIYASMRLSEEIGRMQPAKEKYLENYARHTGCTYQEANERWKEIFETKPSHHSEWTEKSQVSDGVRENLKVAGIDAQTQMNLSTSGRAVHAVEVMEAERQQYLANQPRRSVLSPETKLGGVHSRDSAEGKLQCLTRGPNKGCGQFGHEQPDCPNVEYVQQAQHENKKYEAARDVAVRLERRHTYAQNATDEAIRGSYRLPEDADIDQWRKQQISDYESARDSGELEKARKNMARYEKRRDDQWKNIDSKAELYHDEVDAIHYNPESGVLVITKRSGSPDNPDSGDHLARRCSQQQADDVVQALREKKSLNEALDQYAGGDRNKFANQADMEQAYQEVRCPNCGEWASMNTSHQCPVSGGPSEKLEMENRAARMEQRRREREARKEGGEPGVGLLRPRNSLDYPRNHHRYTPEASQRMGGLRAAVEPHWSSKRFNDVLAEGDLATPHISHTYADGIEVSGNIAMWEQEVATADGKLRTGTFLSAHNVGVERTGLKCNCAQYKKNGNCSHLQNSISIVGRRAAHYTERRVQPAPDNFVPGENPFTASRPDPTAPQGSGEGVRTAPDMLLLNETHTDYDKLRQVRQERINSDMEQFVRSRAADTGVTPVVAVPTTDADGNETEPPATWKAMPTLDNGNPRGRTGKVVDVNDTSACTAAMRDNLSHVSYTTPDGQEGQLHCRVSTRGRKGGITIALPKNWDKKSASQRAAAVRGLCKHLGVSETAYRDGGVFVPNNPGSRAEFLDRSAGNPKTRRITGPQIKTSRNWKREHETYAGATNV